MIIYSAKEARKWVWFLQNIANVLLILSRAMQANHSQLLESLVIRYLPSNLHMDCMGDSGYSSWMLKFCL